MHFRLAFNRTVYLRFLKGLKIEKPACPNQPARKARVFRKGLLKAFLLEPDTQCRESQNYDKNEEVGP